MIKNDNIIMNYYYIPLVDKIDFDFVINQFIHF